MSNHQHYHLFSAVATQNVCCVPEELTFSARFQWQNKDVSYYPVFPLTSILLTTLEKAWGLPFWHLCGLVWQETLVKLLKHEKIIHCPQIGYNSHFLRACWSSGNKSLELENTEGRRDTLCVCPGSGCVPIPKCVCAACVSWVLACRFCNVFHASPGFSCGTERCLLLICLLSMAGG